MGSEARWHELTPEMCSMRSERTAQREGTIITNTYQCSLCSRQCLSRSFMVTRDVVPTAPLPPPSSFQSFYLVYLNFYFFYWMLKIAHLDDASTEIFELDASPVEGQLV